MGYKMKGFSGFNGSPAKQNTENSEEIDLSKKSDAELREIMERQLNNTTDSATAVIQQIKTNYNKKKSPAKQKKEAKKFVKNKGKMQGPIPEQNIGLQPGENEATWVYSGKDKRERMIDYDQRAGVIEQNELMDLEGDNSPKANKRRKQLKGIIKTLDREQQIMRDRIE